MIVTDISQRLRERAASIALAARARPERYQSKTGLLCLEAADMIDLLKGDTDQLHDICDRNEEEIERLRAALAKYACECGGKTPDGVQSCWKQDKCGKEAREALEGK